MRGPSRSSIGSTDWPVQLSTRRFRFKIYAKVTVAVESVRPPDPTSQSLFFKLIRISVATADIPEDTVLFTIPRDAIINTLTSDLPKRVPQIFEDSTAGLEDTDNEADEDGDAAGPPDSWVSLILVMIYEFLQGDNSKWKPYFEVLPEEFETLMFWSEKELEELQASAISSKIGKDEADNMFRAKVLPTIQEHADVFYPQGAQRLNEDQLMALAHRMGSTIMAYAFDLENDDDEPEPEDEDEWMEDKEGQLMMGMVPMADILNADAEFNVRDGTPRPTQRQLLMRSRHT